MRRLSTTVVTLGVAGALAAGCGGGGSSSTKAKPKQPAAPAVQVTMRNGGPSPKVNKNWPLTLTIRHAGKPVASGTVTYQFVAGGSVVGHRGPYRFKHGRYHDELTFPARAVGFPLTFRAVVKTPYGTTNVDQQVTVKK